MAEWADSSWTKVVDQLPPEGVVVRTMIADQDGVRNETSLSRRGNLWFLPDHAVYVYYTPTHWRLL